MLNCQATNLALQNFFNAIPVSDVGQRKASVRVEGEGVRSALDHDDIGFKKMDHFPESISEDIGVHRIRHSGLERNVQGMKQSFTGTHVFTGARSWKKTHKNSRNG